MYKVEWYRKTYYGCSETEKTAYKTVTAMLLEIEAGLNESKWDRITIEKGSLSDDEES